jgi:predicted TIM-barrel fold metal-dependent hydrolase
MSERTVEAIRAELDHPVIDSDGHAIEYLPVLLEILREVGGATAVEGFQRMLASGTAIWGLDTDQMRAAGMVRTSWWGLPTRNTRDRATAMLPALLHERLPEIGIDVAVLYPTYGLMVTGIDDEHLRRSLSRALNLYYAETFSPFADRLLPVGVVPTYTPEEAIEELDFAVGLGLRGFMMGGIVQRPAPGFDPPSRAARWVDTLAHDSVYDYDPLWARCVDHGVSPTFHSAAMGWGSRTSPTSYVYNHIGMFATAGESLCRALVLGGVAHRFPTLRMAFLEGGVAWAASLFSDLVGHWEKRNRDAIEHYDPAHLDRSLLRELFVQHGSERFLAHLDELDSGLSVLSQPDEPRDQLDEFARSGIGSPADLVAMFERFHFGCEADDPMTALAFDDGLPHGVRLRAVFASDIGHWDVPDVREVLPEAWELVDDGHLTTDDFRALTFDNPVSLWAQNQPSFFAGTAVDEAVSRALGAAVAG